MKEGFGVGSGEERDFLELCAFLLPYTGAAQLRNIHCECHEARSEYSDQRISLSFDLGLARYLHLGL